MVKRVPLKLEQKLTIVKLQMFEDHFNAADDELKGGVNMTQFRRAVRNTIGDHVIDEDADTVFMKVDLYDDKIITWEVSQLTTKILKATKNTKIGLVWGLWVPQGIRQHNHSIERNSAYDLSVLEESDTHDTISIRLHTIYY